MYTKPLLDKPLKIQSTDDLGKLVRAFRTSQNLTQADILGLANTGNRFIVELENGKPTVQLNKVLDVLDVLGLEIVLQRKSNPLLLSNHT